MTDGVLKVSCTEWKNHFQFLKNFMKEIPCEKRDAYMALEDAIKRVHIFLGHEHQRTVQDRRIEEVFKERKKQ